jgi:hypothetical protein
MAEKDLPTKEICNWTKAQLENHFALLAKITAEPTVGCSKCGRVANSKKWLCKPKKLLKEDS